MSERFPPGSWSYIGDNVVGVTVDCTCPVEQSDDGVTCYPPHEGHDLITPVMERDRDEEDMPWDDYVAACKLAAKAPDMLHELTALRRQRDALLRYAMLESEFTRACDRRGPDYSDMDLMFWMTARGVPDETPVGAWLADIRQAAIALATEGADPCQK